MDRLAWEHVANLQWREPQGRSVCGSRGLRTQSVTLVSSSDGARMGKDCAQTFCGYAPPIFFRVFANKLLLRISQLQTTFLSLVRASGYNSTPSVQATPEFIFYSFLPRLYSQIWSRFCSYFCLNGRPTNLTYPTCPNIDGVVYGIALKTGSRTRLFNPRSKTELSHSQPKARRQGLRHRRGQGSTYPKPGPADLSSSDGGLLAQFDLYTN